jgi:hypothetical protein
MEPTTLAAIGIGLYFLLAGGDKKNGKKDDPTPDQDDCPEGYTRNAQGQCVAKGTTVDCAPGLVRGNDGKCRKKIKAKPGDDVDPNDISDVKPDVIADDDAWIAPGCASLFYGPDFFRGTIVPAVIEYVDAGYGFAPEYNSEFPVQVPALDRGAVLSTGQIAVTAGMLATYRPECADLLNDFVDQNFPSQSEMQAYETAYGQARQALQDSETYENNYDGDPALLAQFEAVEASNPYLAYYSKLDEFIGNLPGVSLTVKDLIRAILATIETRGNQNVAADLGASIDLTPYLDSYPARFTPKAEDFA